jgi:hypothetical protein
MDIEFLDAPSATAIGTLPLPDVYFTPGYGLSAEFIDRGRWECAVSAGGGHAFPYIRRDIAGEANLYDLVTPYGYSGVAVADSAASRTIVEFRRSYLARARERGLVSEFIRTNPIITPSFNHADLLGVSHGVHRTFGLKIEGEPDAYWSEVSGRHRTAVRRALAQGVNVEILDLSDLTAEDSVFRPIYEATMERLDASDRLRLSFDYYVALRRALSTDSAVVMARAGEVPCAAAIFMRHRNHLHYHLSGATQLGLRLAATNLIIDVAVRKLARVGDILHFGGGLVEGDGLEKFKRSVANTSFEVTFVSNVVSPTQYCRLTEKSGARKNSGAFFPAYRACG